MGLVNDSILGGVDNLEDSFQRLYSRELDLDEGILIR
jgi:hypothetical protein